MIKSVNDRISSILVVKLLFFSSWNLPLALRRATGETHERIQESPYNRTNHRECNKHDQRLSEQNQATLTPIIPWVLACLALTC